ncbi:transcriptional regulator [Streptomyces zhihengii]|uniref:transcriptional regulator n=1 Tax=Streptomyces zhihengii TaxID=1818004 RepID=UPI0033B6FBF4
MATTPEAEEFAAMLRRLKERSGHSYGVLAGRLHVSTSTLHRYCNGDAVPAEFAVVERLARLCGAEREELLTLHRRWILADEARRRGREAARAAGEAGGGPEPAPGIGSGSGTGSTSAAGPGPGSGSGSGLGSISASGSGPGPGSASGSGSAQEDAPEADGTRGAPVRDSASAAPLLDGAPTAPVRDDASTAPDPDEAGTAPDPDEARTAPEPVAPGAEVPDRDARDEAGRADGTGTVDEVAGPGAGRAGEVGGDAVSGPDRAAPSARRKRLVVALAAAAVVALAVPAAVLASHTGTSGDRAAGDAPTAPASRTSGSGPAPSASASVSPSGTPSAGPSPGTSAPSPPVSSPAANGAPATTGVPLRVGISSYNWDSPCGQYYLMGRSPEEIPPPPPPQDYRSWARALDGVDAGDLRLQLTATGKTRDSVVVTAVHVRITGRTEPLAWNAYSMGEGCGSGITPQTFDVDLDKPRPVLRPVAGQQGDITVPATDFPYKVASNDPQVFNLRLHTASHDVRWYVEVDWSSGDRRGTLRIDDEGRPFRTSALAGRPLHEYRPDLGGVWKLREE